MNTAGVAVTGAGLVTSLGRSAAETFAAVLMGRSGIGPMPDLEQRPTPDKGGGQAVDLPSDYRPDLPRAPRYLRFAMEQALEGAGPPTDPRRVGAVFGTTLHGMRAAGDFLRKGDPRFLADFLAGAVLRSAAAGLGIRGPMLTTCSACSSGLGALALGATLLLARAVDRVIVGGYDSVSEYAYAGFDSLRLVADGPARPFGADRSGMKVGEGYGVLVLERMGDALARGHPVLAAVAGWGESSDSFHLTQPRLDGSGAADAIRVALGASGITPAGVGMISAHATATPDNDGAEYAALAAALGPALRGIPVVAFKSHLGHTLGGAGAVELILSIQAMAAGAVPPTAHTGAVDPAFTDLKLERARFVARDIRTTLNLSLGFGGANSCVVLRRDPPPPLKPEAQPDRAVAITGMGLVLPGASNVDELKASTAGGPPVSSDTGPIPEDRYIQDLSARRVRRMSEYAKLSLAASVRACADAGVGGNSAFLAGCSAVLGTTHGASPFCEAFYGQVVREGLGAANPVLFAEGVPNAAAAHLSMALGIRGGCQAIIGTRTAGLDALALAAMRIRRGEWSRAIVSAAEEFSPVVNSAYAACGLHGGARGFRTGSGAVALVLEDAAEARTRGASVWAQIGPACWGGLPQDERDDAESPPTVWSALTGVDVDRATSRSLERTCPAGGHRSVYGALPELFSAGALAAAAAGIVSQPGRPFVACAADFDGNVVSLVLRPVQVRTSASAPGIP